MIENFVSCIAALWAICSIIAASFIRTTAAEKAKFGLESLPLPAALLGILAGPIAIGMCLAVINSAVHEEK